MNCLSGKMFRIQPQVNPFVLSVLLLYLCINGGCRRQSLPPDLPKLYPRSITIHQDGVPLANAVIFLITIDESKWNAGGVTNSSGMAALYTHGLYRGVPAGTYKIIVHKAVYENEILSPPDITENSPEFTSKTTGYSLVDLKYTDRQTTDIEITISPKNEKYVIDLGPPVHDRLPEYPSI